MMQEVHGLCKLKAIGSGDCDDVLTIREGDGFVALWGTASRLALKPDEARFIAQQLIEAADRIEKK